MPALRCDLPPQRLHHCAPAARQGTATVRDQDWETFERDLQWWKTSTPRGLFAVYLAERNLRRRRPA